MADWRKTKPAVDLEGLTPEAMDAIDQLLTNFIAHALAAHRKAAAGAKIAPDFGMFENMATYWKNAAGGMRWARGHFRKTRTAHERRLAAATDHATASAGGGRRAKGAGAAGGRAD